jgi:hypothetical protein
MRNKDTFHPRGYAEGMSCDLVACRMEVRQKLGLLLLLVIPMLLGAQDPARQVPANLREAVLDDFTTQRLGPDSGSPWFYPGSSADHPGQTLSVAGGQLVSGAATGGLQNMYFWRKDPGYNCIWPDGACYLRNTLQSGAWSTSFNRMSFRWRCDNAIGGSQTGTQTQLGAYARDPAYVGDTGSQESGGWHFYHFLNNNQSPWRWVWATLNTHTQHMRATETGADEALPANVTMPTGNYFDLFTTFYFDRVYASYAGSTCYLDDWTMGTQTGEPDYHISSLTYQYTGNHYEVVWQAGRIGEATTFEVRYSAAGSLKTTGFSTGVDAGTVTHPTGGGRAVYWISENMSESSNGLWVGIRPRIPVQSASAATPVSVGIYQHGLTSGDQVYCSGLGVTANANYTATVVDANTVTLNGTTGSGNYAGGGYCKATSDTSRFTEVFIPLAPLVAPGWPVGVTFSGTTTTATTVNFTPEYSATSTTAERRIVGGAWEAAGTTSTGSFVDNGLNPGTRYQYRFKSSNATGTGDYSDTHVAHIYPAVTTAIDSTYPHFTTTVLADSNVGAAYSRQLAAAGGTAPYTFTVYAGTLPAGLSLSSAGAITGTTTTFTALPGAAITFKVTDANSRSGYLGLYLPVNQLPAADNFNRADGTYNGYWSNTGLMHNMDNISGNQAYPVGESGSRRTREWFSADQWSEASITATTATSYVGPGVRNTETTGGYFCFQTPTQLCLTRVNQGGYIVSQTCSDVAWQSGDVVRAEAFDSTIRCFSNGVLKATITNADIPSGAPGIGGKGGASTTLDDWSGGNISTPIITTETLLEAVVGYSYSTTLVVARGVGPFAWSVASGPLPAGLALSSAGVLSGTPTTAGTVSFTVRTVDSEGTASADKTLALTTLASIPPLSVATATLAEGRTAIAYTHTLVATGGLSPYTWTLVSGDLPAGLTFSTGGVISGTTLSAVSVNLTVRVTDRLGGTSEKALTLSVIATVSASDNFNRAEGTPVGGSNGWLAVGGANGFFIISNAARVYDSGASQVSAHAYGNLPPSADQYAIVRWKASSAGPAVRLATTTVNGYGCMPANGKLGIYPLVHAYYWGTVLIETDYTPSVDDEIKLSASGTNLKCFVNGVEMLSVSDDRYASGYTGIVGRANGIVDDWEGGNISGPSPSVVKSRRRRIVSQ